LGTSCLREASGNVVGAVADAELLGTGKEVVSEHASRRSPAGLGLGHQGSGAGQPNRPSVETEMAHMNTKKTDYPAHVVLIHEGGNIWISSWVIKKRALKITR